MINEYLKLKSKIIYRIINDFGTPPIIGFSIIVLSFVYFSHTIEEYGIPHFLIFLIFLSVFIPYNNNRRDRDQLELYFKYPKGVYLVENLLISLPFVILSVYLSNYELAVSLTIFLILFSCFNLSISLSFLDKINFSYLMPDVEFIWGIRKFWYIHFISLIFIFAGFYINNSNLSIFGFTLYILIFGFYFQIVEITEWIWLYPVTAKEFINNKITSVFIKMLLLSIWLILLMVYWLTSFDILFISCILFLGVINQMLSKYAKYNSSISIQISQSISIAVTLIGVFYPLFIIFNIFYFFYLKREAIKTINNLFNVGNSRTQ